MAAAIGLKFLLPWQCPLSLDSDSVVGVSLGPGMSPCNLALTICLLPEGSDDVCVHMSKCVCGRQSSTTRLQ